MLSILLLCTRPENSLHFIFKRTGLALITVILVSVLSFIMFDVLPGDPATYILGTEASAEQIEALREELGLTGSLPSRYINWMGNFISGKNLNSIRFYGRAVDEILKERLPVSFTMALLSLFFILLISVPASLLPAGRSGGITDRFVNAMTAVGISIPAFFLALIFTWVFGITLKLFIPGGYVDYRENFTGFIACLCFPALAVAVPNAAILTKFLRSALHRELESDYIRTARSKGAPYSRVLFRHALRNALVTSVTVLGMIIAEVFSGSIVIEQVFNIPGIGRLLITSIMSRDYPLIQSLVVYIAWTVVLANLLADTAIQIIDPRIRLERSVLSEAQ